MITLRWPPRREPNAVFMSPSRAGNLPPEPATAAPQWAWYPHPAGTLAETIARRWLAERFDCAAESLPLRRDSHGRPRLQGSLAGWDTSWSHSGDGLLVAKKEWSPEAD